MSRSPETRLPDVAEDNTARGTRWEFYIGGIVGLLGGFVASGCGLLVSRLWGLGFDHGLHLRGAGKLLDELDAVDGSEEAEGLGVESGERFVGGDSRTG